MPRRCTVCQHPERETIDKLLVGGWASNRGVALHYGLVHTSVDRHAKRHLHPLMQAA